MRVATFGRAGRRGAAEHVGLKGFAQFDEGLDALKIDRKLLGLRPPEITLPLEAIERIDDRLVIRRDVLGGSEMPLSAFESASNMKEQPVSEERLADIWGDYRDAEAQTDFEGAKLDKVAFNIERVRCVDETNPERALFVNFHDEIAIGGQSIDEDGDVKLISEHYVGGGFDDGDQRLYNPARRMHWFSLNEGRAWPKEFRVVLSLAEKDWGRFQAFLDRVYRMIQAKVAAAIKKGVGSVLTPYVGPALGALIGAAVAYVVDRLVKFLIGLFGDDLFDPVVCKLRHGGYGGRWANGSTRSPDDDRPLHRTRRSLHRQLPLAALPLSRDGRRGVPSSATPRLATATPLPGSGPVSASLSKPVSRPGVRPSSIHPSSDRGSAISCPSPTTTASPSFSPSTDRTISKGRKRSTRTRSRTAPTSPRRRSPRCCATPAARAAFRLDPNEDEPRLSSTRLSSLEGAGRQVRSRRSGPSSRSRSWKRPTEVPVAELAELFHEPRFELAGTAMSDQALTPLPGGRPL